MIFWIYDRKKIIEGFKKLLIDKKISKKKELYAEQDKSDTTSKHITQVFLLVKVTLSMMDHKIS